jgi:hypothetical protein
MVQYPGTLVWNVKNPVLTHGVLQRKSHFEFHVMRLKAHRAIPLRSSERDIGCS